MASLITVRLNKGDYPSWGFRLQGGKDFGTPLVVQKVNVGSPAERAGLVAGDSVIKVNNVEVYDLRHKDAQDVVLRAGNNFDMTVQRGGSTWKPHVTPTGSYPSQSPSINNVSPVTNTSLKHNRQENVGAIGTKHNVSAKPFAVNGTALNGNVKLVNKQYNSPLNLYSEQSIAETLAAQAEVLSTGALGVNFKKNEKNYDASKSAVYHMLQEAEKEPRSPDADGTDSGIDTRPNLGITGLRHVSAPETRPPSNNNQQQLPPGQNICADCERLIVGVFVRIKDKNLHVECFKCATCGSSLKNQGYYNINNKLYCDVHAKLAARNNPPAPNLVPVTVPPGGRAPANAISSALSYHSSLPTPSPASPKLNNYGTSYQSQDDQENVSTSFQSLNVTNEANINKNNNSFLNHTPLSFSKFLNKGASPRGFSSVSAPLSPPRGAPLSPVAPPPSVPSYSPISSTGHSVTSILWPPVQEEKEELPTASPLYVPPPSCLHVVPKKKTRTESESYDIESSLEVEEINNMAQYQKQNISYYSDEISSARKSNEQCIEIISETLEKQRLVDNILGIKTPGTSCELKRPTEYTPNTLETPKTQTPVAKSEASEVASRTATPKVENTVPKLWESQMVQALKTAPDKPYGEASFSQIPEKHSMSALASALATAPAEPFTPKSAVTFDPVPLPEETVPYIPPEHPIIPQAEESKEDVAAGKKDQKKSSKGLTPAFKRKNDPTDVYFEDLPKPQGKMTMLAALTVAPERSYTPLLTESAGIYEKLSEESSYEEVKREETKTTHIDKSTLQKPLKPTVLPASISKAPKKDIPKPPAPFSAIHKYSEATDKSKDHQACQQIKSSGSCTSGQKNPSSVTSFSSIQESSEDKSSTKAELKQTRVIETTTEKTFNPASSFKPISEDAANFPPIFQGFTCSFQNKTDHSQFSVEVSTTPPIIYHKNTQPASSEHGNEVIKKLETVTERSSHVVEEQKESKSKNEKRIEKQAEEVIFKKPLPLTSSLHKPDNLPQYQVTLSESAEADLQLMKKIETAQMRHKQKSNQTSQVLGNRSQHENNKPEMKPVIKIQAEAPNTQFVEDRPASTTFSPRPRPLTPSMISKPPPTIPYYQSNLVPQQYSAPPVNLLDPATPNLSRSPSPCPDRQRERSPSPFPGASSIRPKSPAAGPPANPLSTASFIPLPTPQNTKREAARKNIEGYIPHHQSKERSVHTTSQDSKAPLIYTSQIETRTVPSNNNQSACKSLCIDNQLECSQRQTFEAQQSHMREVKQTHEGNKSTTLSISAAQQQQHLEEQKRTESRSVEKSADGRTQVQRKKTVTEEFEHTHKSNTVQIEKSSTTKHSFRDVNLAAVEAQEVIGLHVTNPQPIMSPFLNKCPATTEQTKICPQTGRQCQQTCQKSKCCTNTSSAKECCLASAANQNKLNQFSTPAPAQSVKHATSSSVSNLNVNRPDVPLPDLGSGGGRQTAAVGVSPRRGRGVLNAASLSGTRVPLCGQCHNQIRGPFITALGKIWCPEHFICTTPSCRRPLQDLGFVEERGQLYCEFCFEQYLAPQCSKCMGKIKGDCLKAIGKNFHPECFNCVYCGKLFGNSPFFLEDANPYCEADWNELFTTKCYACGFPIEAGDRWVEALSNNYHSQCFNCTMCKKNLEGQSFCAKGGRPYCKAHAR